MTDEELDQHYPDVDVEENPEYAYSPSLFVKAGIPIGLFDNDKFGIIIQTPRLIPAWCSGLAGEVKTDGGTHINFGANELEFEYDAQHHTKKVTSAEISLMLSRLFKEYLSEGYYGLEKYDLCISPPGLSYNEGLFRYRRQDIQGIIVCKTSRSAYYAMRFRKMCRLKALSFYVYDPAGQVIPISERKVTSLAAKYRPEDDPCYALLRKFSVATSAHEEDVEVQVRPLPKKDGQGRSVPGFVHQRARAL